MEKEIKYSSIKVLKKLFGLIKKYWYAYAIIAVASVFSAAANISINEGIRKMVNSAVSKDMTLFKQGIIFSVAGILGEILFYSAIIYASGFYRLKIQSITEGRLVGHLLKGKLKNIQENHSQDLISRITSSSRSAVDGVSDKVQMILNSIIELTMFFVYFSTMNIKLAILAIIVAIILPMILNPVSSLARKAYDKRQKKEAEIYSYMQDVIQGGETVRVYGLKNYFKEKVEHSYKDYFRLLRKLLIWDEIIWNTKNLVNFGGRILLIAYGGLLVFNGEIEIGGVTTILIAFGSLVYPVQEIVSSWAQLQQSISAGARMFEIFDMPLEKKVVDLEKHIDNYEGILLSNVTFGYKQDENILNNINLMIPKGKVTALVGNSGGGKSTLLKLLLRFYDIEKGSIEYNGSSIVAMEPEKWREKISYVSQNPYLFTGTVMDNIKCAKSGAKEEEVYEAAKKAQIHDFIMTLPKGYDTFIGEKGYILSGGQKQRVAIARAILKNAEILLMDEPTSALDSENEEEIQNLIYQGKEHRITIVVAHRLSTIRQADNIAIIENGNIVEQGKHNELMKLQGVYYKLNYKDLGDEGVTAV